MVVLAGNHFVLCTIRSMLFNHIQLGTYYQLAIPSAITTVNSRIGSYWIQYRPFSQCVNYIKFLIKSVIFKT